jgi:hypothetical protein
VLYKLGLIVGVCVVAEMFAEPNGERSSSLSDIRFVTVGAGQFVYSEHLVFVSGVRLSVCRSLLMVLWVM